MASPAGDQASVGGGDEFRVGLVKCEGLGEGHPGGQLGTDVRQK